ncbi:MAG: hypothetical protein ACKVTZ_22760 [Bacteroidia bacterium]
MRYFTLISFLLFSNILFAQKQSAVKSRQIKAVSERFWDNEKPKNNEWSVRKYDKKGRVAEELELDKDSLPEKWQRFTYNNLDKVKTIEKLDKKGELRRKVVCEYNMKGDKTREITTDKEGKLVEKLEISYNAFGDKSEEIETDEKESVKKRTIYLYDDKGMLLERNEFDAEGKLSSKKKYRYEY